MTTVQLRPRLHRLILGTFQAYLWVDPDGVTLIDTGAVGSGPAIAAALAEIGLATSDVDQVVLTHFHDDHTGSAAEVGAWPGVRVVAHTLDAPVIRGERPGPPPNFTDAERVLHAQVAGDLRPAPPARVDREVVDGDVLDFGGGALVVGTPGHTDGSIAVHLPAHGVLFTGDIAAEHAGEVMFGVFHIDRERAYESFRRVAGLDVETACFGHGEPVLTGAAARLWAATR